MTLMLSLLWWFVSEHVLLTVGLAVAIAVTVAIGVTVSE